MFGGMLPVMQSCVADVSNENDRPKYIGRIMATFGMGFVLGPALSALISSSSLVLSTRDKIQLSALLPLTGFIISFIFFKETKNINVNINNGSGKNDKVNYYHHYLYHYNHYYLTSLIQPCL